MNHDYAHCLDYTPDCPKECFRAQLQRDLEERRSEFIGVPLTCSHLGGTVECKLAKCKDVTCKMSLETDCVNRQAAIGVMCELIHHWFGGDPKDEIREIRRELEKLPSAQSERTCVNCGRTANNGGWYADGGTRCPIEEHYALPKDGYCHLWEKRNVTDDDYPERDEDGYVWIIRGDACKRIDALPSAQPDVRKESKDESGI